MYFCLSVATAPVDGALVMDLQPAQALALRRLFHDMQKRRPSNGLTGYWTEHHASSPHGTGGRLSISPHQINSHGMTLSGLRPLPPHPGMVALDDEGPSSLSVKPVPAVLVSPSPWLV